MRKRSGELEVEVVMGKVLKSALLVSIEMTALKTSIDKIQRKNAELKSNKILAPSKNAPSKNYHV